MNTVKSEQTDRTLWSTYPAEIVWYPSPRADDLVVLVEILIHGMQEESFEPGSQAIGSVKCENVDAALAEVPLLQLERGLIFWYGAVAVRLTGDRYPREWHRINCGVPGHSWPEKTVELGACLECSGTGVCPECGGAELNTYDYCICGHKGYCPLCLGSRLLPAPYYYATQKIVLELARRYLAELYQARRMDEQQAMGNCGL